jgi:hypothetical protein
MLPLRGYQFRERRGGLGQIFLSLVACQVNAIWDFIFFLRAPFLGVLHLGTSVPAAA